MITHTKFGRHAIAAIAFAAASPTFAHPGLDHSHGFASGIVHPLTGLDHVVAMIGIGMLATLGGGKLRWPIPLSLLVAMAFGGIIGLGHPVAAIETAVAISVIGIGLWIIALRKGTRAFAIPTAAVIGLLHGWTHGAFAAPNGTGMLFLAGALMASSFLALLGAAAGRRLASLPIVQRWVGCAILLAGLGVMVA